MHSRPHDQHGLGQTEQTRPSKHYVRPAKPGQPISDDEALAMGYALFDQIASEQAKAARQEGADHTRG